jgi:hypothetical protein
MNLAHVVCADRAAAEAAARVSYKSRLLGTGLSGRK